MSNCPVYAAQRLDQTLSIVCHEGSFICDYYLQSFDFILSYSLQGYSSGAVNLLEALGVDTEIS